MTLRIYTTKEMMMTTDMKYSKKGEFRYEYFEKYTLKIAQLKA